MSKLTRRNSAQTKSANEFGKAHNEKSWRQKRVNRKALRDRKNKDHRAPHYSSSKRKPRQRQNWNNHVVAEKNEWDNFHGHFEIEDHNYMCDDADRWFRQYESANEFVNLIRDVLGGEFHGQEFKNPVVQTEQADETVGEFRIVFPDTTPRSACEVWITLTNARLGGAKSPQSSRSIRLFRLDSTSLGDKTLVEFLDVALNEIAQDMFELSVPTTLVAIISSFCKDMGSDPEFKCVGECNLTIGDGLYCKYDRIHMPCYCHCDFCCDCWCKTREIECYGSYHAISMGVHARVGCDDERAQLDAMSRDWEEMAVWAFLYSECSSHRRHQAQRGRQIEMIMMSAKMRAASWSVPGFKRVVKPVDGLDMKLVDDSESEDDLDIFRDEPLLTTSSLNPFAAPFVPRDWMFRSSNVLGQCVVP